MQDFDKRKKAKRQSGISKEMPTVTKTQYEKKKAAAEIFSAQKRNPSPMSEADYERKRANNMGANVDRPSTKPTTQYERNDKPLYKMPASEARKQSEGPSLSRMSEHHATSAQEAELKRGRDMPLSATPIAAPRSRVAEVLSSIRQNRADNLSSKADKIKAVADRKESSADKISARKQGKAEIIRARAELIKAKQGR
jgi:hypothetical protein